MKHYHAAIWIDHAGARVFSLNADDAEEWAVRPHERHAHIHHKAGSIGAGKAAGDPQYFKDLAAAVKDAGAILVTGPGTAKSEFAAFLKAKHPDIAAKVAAVEALDHPSDGQLVAFARKFFRAADRMTRET
jgi:stalled ribosome rescue protein Dom34